MTDYTIKTITLDECLPIRHHVLWPNLTLNDCIDPEDDSSLHYGYILNSQIISCLSVLSLSPTKYCIRKFATLPDFQGQGIGSALFRTVLTTLKKQNVRHVCLNARITAQRFYDKFNFHAGGNVFTKRNVDFIPMQISLDNYSA